MKLACGREYFKNTGDLYVTLYTQSEKQIINSQKCHDIT